MDFPAILLHMQRTSVAIQALIEDIGDAQARWKPDPDSWSILEVINHLFDEEREDFRVRLDYILHRPGEQAPPIDPAGWVTSRRYNERDLAKSLFNFLEERAASLTWLSALDSPNFQLFVEGPFGRISAGDMLAAWAAHDLLHMRQLVELKYLFLKKNVEPYGPGYAGSW